MLTFLLEDAYEVPRFSRLSWHMDLADKVAKQSQDFCLVILQRQAQ